VVGTGCGTKGGRGEGALDGWCCRVLGSEIRGRGLHDLVEGFMELGWAFAFETLFQVMESIRRSGFRFHHRPDPLADRPSLSRAILVDRGGRTELALVKDEWSGGIPSATSDDECSIPTVFVPVRRVRSKSFLCLTSILDHTQDDDTWSEPDGTLSGHGRRMRAAQIVETNHGRSAFTNAENPSRFPPVGAPETLPQLSLSGLLHEQKESGNVIDLDSTLPYEHGAHQKADSTARHLVVLVHGLSGKPEDMGKIEELMRKDAAVGQRGVLIHATDVNVGRTTDGVRNGGKRVAGDIVGMVRKYPSLEKISIVGFSLGGVYARYAVADLFDIETKTVAGLKPILLMTVASPNLGVRNFGVYRKVPKEIHWLSKVVAGQTGMDVMLRDRGVTGDPVLVEMTDDSSALPFIASLRAFQKRVLYGNCRNDMMVNFGTATLDPAIRDMSIDDTFAPPEGAEIIDDTHDEGGCRVWYRYDMRKTDKPSHGIRRVDSYESLMALRLRGVGWTVVGVDFPTALPVAHNRIVAMSRSPMDAWLNSSGYRAARHIVQTLLECIVSES